MLAIEPYTFITPPPTKSSHSSEFFQWPTDWQTQKAFIIGDAGLSEVVRMLQIRNVSAWWWTAHNLQTLAERAEADAEFQHFAQALELATKLPRL